MKTLNQSTASLDDTRRRVLFNLLKERYAYNPDITDDYIQREMDRYLALLNQGTPILTPRPQSGMTDADKINEEMQESQIDIHTVFQQLEHTARQINQHQKLNQSIMADIHLKIQKTEERLEAYRHLLVNRSAHAVIYETFLDYNSLEKDYAFYTERDGTIVSSANRLKLDVYKNAIKLPTIYTEDAVTNFAGLRVARIGIKSQLGGGFVRSRNPEHQIEKAFDSSMETFWSETIFTDAPLEVDMGADGFGISFGAACVFDVDFDRITRVNEITLTPFSEYPMEVVAVLAYSTDNKSEDPFILVSPVAQLSSKESVDVISYQFQEMACKRLRFIVNQKHYVKRDLIMAVEEKSITDAWLKTQGHYAVDERRIFNAVYSDQMELHPHWFYLDELLRRRDIVDEVVRSTTRVEEKVRVNKYEYQYGLSNLSILRNEYHSYGVYVTQPMVNQNIHVVTMEATEEHPSLDTIGLQVTNIEYYITDKPQPLPDDWIPIMPRNVRHNYCERLFPTLRDGKYKATTLFDIQHVSAVRKNGSPMMPTEYRLSGRTVTISSYNPSAIYTIDYIPEESASYVDFLARYTDEKSRVQTQLAIEPFTDLQKGNTIKLNYHPFVDKSQLHQQSFGWNPTYLSNVYLPIKVRMIMPDGQHVDQPSDKDDTTAIVVNKTDYFNPNVSLLEPFTGENYQYRVVGNELKFNANLPKGTQLIVEYPYLTGPIRMKVIMRRNLQEADGLTPFLHEYKVVFQSLV